jgi:hypothetical protein
MLNRHGVKAIVVVNSVITRADIAEDLAEVIGVNNAELRMANMDEIKRYLEIEDRSSNTERGST